MAGENRGVGGGERKERKDFFIGPNRLLIRNISAVKSITTLTQLTLC